MKYYYKCNHKLLVFCWIKLLISQISLWIFRNLMNLAAPQSFLISFLINRNTLGRCPFFAWLTSFSHILVRIFLLFTFLLWHSLSSTYFCCTQLSFSQFSPGITLPQLNSTLHNFATHTSALAEFCLSSVFYLKV